MLKNIKKIILHFFYLLNFLIVCLIEVPKCLFLIFLNKKKYYFYQSEGGFGHLISTPMFLNSQFDSDWLLVFSYQKSRYHNKYIKKIFPKNLIFLNNGILTNFLGIITSHYYCELTMSVIKFFCNIFFKINLKEYYDLLSKFKKKNYKKETSYFKGYESKCWREIVDYSKDFDFSENIKEELKIFFSRFKKGCVGNVLFPIRTKGSNKSQKDYSNKLRDSRDINDYKKILEDLVSRNYLIFLSGDKIVYPDWINSQNNIITFDKTNLDKNYFNLMAGIGSDIVIGGPSGATMFSMFGKKNLFLESLDFGVGFNNTIISHPKIKDKDIKNIKELLTERFIENKIEFYSEQHIELLDKNELFEIYYEFIENINNKNYGIDPNLLGINEGWLIDSRSKISNKWLDLNNIIY